MRIGHVNEVGDDLRDVGDRGHLVRVQRPREDRSGHRIDNALLGERVADALDDPALHLARRAELVDHAADIVNRDDLVDANLARLDVDGDLRHLDTERQHLHAGRVWPARAFAEDLAVLEQAGDLRERPRTAVGGDDLAVLHVEHALLEVEPLCCDLDQLAFRVGGRRAHGRAHRGHRRRAGRDRCERPAGRVAERDLHMLERDAELLGGDLCHRGARAGADVLHRRDDLHAAVRAQADPGVRRWSATAVPDLRGETDAVLPRSLAARTHLVALRPVRLRAPVALFEILGGERTVVDPVGAGVVATAQLERVEVQLRRQLVEEAFERECALDEPGRAERGHRRQVQLRRELNCAHVVARVQHLHRPFGRGRPAGEPNRVDELAAERNERSVGLGGRRESLDRRVAVARRDVLLAPRERALDRAARALRELGRDRRVVAGAVLRAEAAAHGVADDAHLVRRKAEVLGHGVADAPDVLGRDVDRDAVVLPVADGLVRLHRVVQDDLCPVLGLDDDVGLRDAALEVAPLVVLHVRDERLAADGLVWIEQRHQHLPLGLEPLDRRLRLAERLGGDGGDGLPDVARVLFQHVKLTWAEHAARARSRPRRVQVDPCYTRARVRAAQNRDVEHAGQLQVGCVRSLASRPLDAVDAGHLSSDGRQRPFGPLFERVLLDDDPDVLVAAFDFLLGADQSCHVLMASSILG